MITKLILNSMDPKYGGHSVFTKKSFRAVKKECDGKPYSFGFRLPGYGALVFLYQSEKEKKAAEAPKSAVKKRTGSARTTADAPAAPQEEKTKKRTGAGTRAKTSEKKTEPADRTAGTVKAGTAAAPEKKTAKRTTGGRRAAKKPAESGALMRSAKPRCLDIE